MNPQTKAIAERISRLSDHFEQLVEGTAPDAWSSSSPCEGWTARDVVGHVVDVHGMMLKPLDRALSHAPPVDEDPLAAFRAARADVAAVLADPQLAGTEYDGFFGRSVVQDTIDGFLGFDLVIHAWDLARATGQDETIDPAEAERITNWTGQFGEALRTPGVCGPAVEVPDDSSPQDKLLAFLGRNPH